MTRIVKAHAVRRDEILDAARRLIQTKSYEHMTIRDIVSELQISNGAFFHYFDSKLALLTALNERTMRAMAQLFQSINDDPKLSAPEKFNRCFVALDNYKTGQKPFLLALAQTQYGDGNAVVRQSARALFIKIATPQLSLIIRQGIQEGVLSTDYPDHTSGVVVSLLQDLKDAIAALFPSFTPEPTDLPEIISIVGAYTQAIERTLGARSGTLTLANVQTLKQWLDSPTQ